MPKLKKSELKKYLQSGVQAIKHGLPHAAYAYLVLASLFFYHVNENNTGGSTARITFKPITLLRRKRDFQSELIDAFLTVENSNPPLKGVLLPAISQTAIPDSALHEYWGLLDELHQSTGVFSSPQTFGQAYEYWIAQLANLTIKSGVAFHTQPALTRLSAHLLKPEAGMSIYDPTAGTGGLLVACADYVRQQGNNLESTHFYAREKAPDVWAICKMNLLVHHMENISVEHGDSLEITQDVSGMFDLVVQNFPLSPDPENKGLSRRLYDRFLRHAIDSLSPYGRAALLAPISILHQDHADLWQNILTRDWLEAVITLPPKLLQGTNASACLLIVNKQKAADRSGNVLFIQFPSNFATHSRHNELADEDVQQIVDAFDRWGKGSAYARVMPISRIESQAYNLNIERYPDWAEPAESFDLSAALNRYRAAVRKRETAIEQFLQSLEGLDHSVKALQDEKSQK